jgi:glycosyltransferase involved in cell wall biosynthesis
MALGAGQARAMYMRAVGGTRVDETTIDLVAAESAATIDLVAEEELDRNAAKITVVIPTLNEAENLPLVLGRIPSWIDEVIIVDGLSTDDTIAVARQHLPDVRIVLESTPGKGAALRAGFRAATGHIIVMLDADGSTDPAEIPVFVGALLGGADIAVGSRFVQGGGTADMETHRKLGNWVLTRLVRLGFGARYSDLCYGYTAFWRDVFPYLDGDYTGFEVETLIHIRALRAELTVAEVPSFEAPRQFGVSNLRTVQDGARVLRSIATEWLSHRKTTKARDTAVPSVGVLPGARPRTPPFQEDVRERRKATT